MAQEIITEGLEDATVTFGSAYTGSSAALLKDRSNLTLGLNSPTGTTTQEIIIDFGSGNGKPIDKVVLPGLLSDGNIGINTYVWDGASYLAHAIVSTDTYEKQNYNVSVSSYTTERYKIEFTRAAGSTLELAGVYLGEKFEFPTNYLHNNDREMFFRGERIEDFHGYPISMNTTAKAMLEAWRVTFQMTAAQLETLKTKLGYCWMDKKPFIFLDQQLDNTHRLVRLDQSRLVAKSLSYDYYEIEWRCTEL